MAADLVASLAGGLASPLAVEVAPVQTDDWGFVRRNAPYLLEGTLLTVALTVSSLLLGFLLGFPGGALEVYGGSLSRAVVRTVGIVLRGTPIVVIFIVMYFVLPVPTAFLAGVLGLGLRSAAYQTQIFRGALQSVDEGQMEAARAVGMDTREALQTVVVPQALRRSVPGFQNEATIVLKDTSVVFAIGLSELITRSFELFTRQTTAVAEVLLFASAVYFVLTFATNRGLDRLERVYRVPSGEAT